MQADERWQRAALLFNQRRYDLATQELRLLLTEAPEHWPAHALLAQTLVETAADDRGLDEALGEARRAVALAPDEPQALGAVAAVHWARRELDQAAAANAQAIALDPDDVHHRRVQAQIRLGQKRWADALAAADAGLEIDPEDTDCLNLRAFALVKLGRSAEATDAVDASLARDPDNAQTHQARGFARLNAGDADGAVHHFQEALRRDPMLDGARAGLVEALKAKNPLYRQVLRWFLWLERFSGKQQIAIVFGLWLAARAGSAALREAGQPMAATLVTYSWLGFVLLTTCAVPIFNLLLLLHPLGRVALERRARNDALLLGAALLAALGVGAHAWLGDATWSEIGWIFWLIYLLPVAGIGVFHPGWGRAVLQVFCAAAAVAFVWWVVRLEQLLPVWNSAPPAISPELRAHVELFWQLVMAVALSTWFVMLAPKGHPPRRPRR
jgi:tetratricopeptide (TPR) repeat protein